MLMQLHWKGQCGVEWLGDGEVEGLDRGEVDEVGEHAAESLWFRSGWCWRLVDESGVPSQHTRSGEGADDPGEADVESPGGGR